jgi:hypothetical protein
MLYAIDGIPVPQRTGTLHFKSTFGDMPKAKFIIDNLNPDSVIGWIDYEGLEAPTYEGLMMWARMILPNYQRPAPKPPGTLEMRRACALLCGITAEQMKYKTAKYISAGVLEEINKAIETKRMVNRRAMMERYKGHKMFVLDSLGSSIENFDGSDFEAQLKKLDINSSRTALSDKLNRHFYGAR